MKLKICALAALLAFSGASFATPKPVELGVIDADVTSFGKTFGRIFGLGAPVGPFTDYYTFSIGSASTATGGAISWKFGSVSLNMTGVSLSGGSLLSPQYDSSPDSFTFVGLGIGTYTLGVSGVLRDVGLGGMAGYTGTLSAVSVPVPEAETYAMLFVGLTAAGAMSLRRTRRM